MDWPERAREQMTYATSRVWILCPPPILRTLEWDRQQNPFPDVGMNSESPWVLLSLQQGTGHPRSVLKKENAIWKRPCPWILTCGSEMLSQS